MILKDSREGSKNGTLFQRTKHKEILLFFIMIELGRASHKYIHSGDYLCEQFCAKCDKWREDIKHTNRWKTMPVLWKLSYFQDVGGSLTGPHGAPDISTRNSKLQNNSRILAPGRQDPAF